MNRKKIVTCEKGYSCNMVERPLTVFCLLVDRNTRTISQIDGRWYAWDAGLFQVELFCLNNGHFPAYSSEFQAIAGNAVRKCTPLPELATIIDGGSCTLNVPLETYYLQYVCDEFDSVPEAMDSLSAEDRSACQEALAKWQLENTFS